MIRVSFVKVKLCVKSV